MLLWAAVRREIMVRVKELKPTFAPSLICREERPKGVPRER